MKGQTVGRVQCYADGVHYCTEVPFHSFAPLPPGRSTDLMDVTKVEALVASECYCHTEQWLIGEGIATIQGKRGSSIQGAF